MVHHVLTADVSTLRKLLVIAKEAIYVLGADPCAIFEQLCPLLLPMDYTNAGRLCSEDCFSVQEAVVRFGRICRGGTHRLPEN